MRYLLLVIISLMLAACSEEPRWKDRTGMGRGYRETRADNESCLREVRDWEQRTGIKLLPVGVVNRVDLCMVQRGWG